MPIDDSAIEAFVMLVMIKCSSIIPGTVKVLLTTKLTQKDFHYVKRNIPIWLFSIES